MKPNEYKFEVGDKVITIYGEVGRITEICDCESCKKRGFCEPTWVEDGSDNERYITNWYAEGGFNDFYQIGKYKFGHKFNKKNVLENIEYFEKVLAQQKNQLKVIEESEKEERLKTSCSNCKHRLSIRSRDYSLHNYICGHPNHLGDFVQPYTVCADFEEREDG